jgi:hypothetical protein
VSAVFPAAIAAVSSSDFVSSAQVESPCLLQVSSVATIGEDLGPVVLRNMGSKPLRLRAEMLAEGGNNMPGSECWHEIAIYGTETGQVAVALRLLRAAAGDIGVHRAQIFEDIDAAATWLEQFDTSADLAPDFDVADRRQSTATVVLKAASLRERAERLDRAYRGLLGELLYRLELNT